ncbi:hypothetical protein Patl1_32846 [Pistacia atlantica]|uniref:Uncharacterized protein n=1 Tax=Pistacia atlantica TaxID=434234 RepID=A0ACC1ANF3_9ROSI|nr:hypothetical protein Patl1_32846 [Pistacia atlantica]
MYLDLDFRVTKVNTFEVISPYKIFGAWRQLSTPPSKRFEYFFTLVSHRKPKTEVETPNFKLNELCSIGSRRWEIRRSLLPRSLDVGPRKTNQTNYCSETSSNGCGPLNDTVTLSRY